MPERITDNFYFIRRGWLNANHFVFNGRKDKVLIDTGYRRDLDDTLRLIRQTALDPRDVTLIVSSHSHCDHVGANRAVQELSGCEIAMHPIDRHYIETKNDWYTWWRYYEQEAEYFPVHRSLEDGQTVRLDDMELVVLHTPGHASGQISLYSPRHQFLISADALWDGDFGVLTTRIEGNISPFLQQQSLDRLADLDISVIYPGHGNTIHDPRGAIYRCQKRLQSFLEKPERMGRDQIKKIILYVLMMKSGFPAESFFGYLMDTPWYREVVDLYFRGQYEPVYRDIMAELTSKDLVRCHGGRLLSTLEP